MEVRMRVYALVCLAIALCVAEANINFPNQDQKVAVGRAMDLASQAIDPLLQRYATLGVFDHSKKTETGAKKATNGKRVDKEIDEHVLGDMNDIDKNFSARFMNLFRPSLVMPDSFTHRGSSEKKAPPSNNPMSMFAPAPPPPGGIGGKPPPPPACLPPGEPRRIWARDSMLTNVDVKYRRTPATACAYECALRCAPCKKEDEKLNQQYYNKPNIINSIVTAPSFLEEKFVGANGKHDMKKCEKACMPGCLKDPALAGKSKTVNRTKLSTFLELSSRITKPSLTPEQTLLMRQKLAAKFGAGVSTSNSHLRGNSKNSGIVKPQYADQRGINDGMHRYQGVGATIRNAANLGANTVQGQKAAAGAAVNGKVGGGGPWWLNPPPWWLPPPPEWGSPPPSVYSPFYSPYSIQQSGGQSPSQNAAPAYTPTPLPYFFLQMGQPVVEKYNRFQ